MLLACCLFSAALCHAGEKTKLVANLKSGKQQLIITYGTSLTAGSPWVQQLQQELNRYYPGKAYIINSGSRGMWSKWGVDNLDHRVIDKKPDTVFIEFAINDAYQPYKTPVDHARNNLENMIDRILAANANCEIIIMVMNPPTGVYLERRPKIEAFYQMYRDIAKEREILLIDHYPKWKKILDTNPDMFNKYVPDGIHPGPEGCKAVITPEIIESIGIRTEQKDSGN